MISGACLNLDLTTLLRVAFLIVTCNVLIRAYLKPECMYGISGGVAMYDSNTVRKRIVSKRDLESHRTFLLGKRIVESPNSYAMTLFACGVFGSGGFVRANMLIIPCMHAGYLILVWSNP